MYWNVLKCIEMYWVCIEVYWSVLSAYWSALKCIEVCIECVFPVCIYYTSATPTDSQWPDTPKQMAVAAIQDCTPTKNWKNCKIRKRHRRFPAEQVCNMKLSNHFSLEDFKLPVLLEWTTKINWQSDNIFIFTVFQWCFFIILFGIIRQYLALWVSIQTRQPLG